MLTDTQVLGLTWIHSHLHTQRYTDTPPHTHTPVLTHKDTTRACSVHTLRQAHTDTSPGMHGRTPAHTHADKHSLACRQVGTDLDRVGKQAHRQLGSSGSRNAALSLCTAGRTDLGHGPPPAHPSHKALRQPPTSHQPGELLPALEHPGPAMSAPSAWTIHPHPTNSPSQIPLRGPWGQGGTVQSRSRSVAPSLIHSTRVVKLHPLQVPTVLQGTSTSGVPHCTVWPGPQTRTQLLSCCLLRSMSKTKPGTEAQHPRKLGQCPAPAPGPR